MLNDLKPLFQIIDHVPLEAWPVIIMVALLLFSGWWGRKKHLLCTLEAYQELKRLKGKPGNYQMTHLRSVDPFVFEEMVLTAIKRQGHSIYA